MPLAAADNSWKHGNNNHYDENTSINSNSNGNGTMSAAPGAEECGVQTRAMGLKVHYTFDKEAKMNYLARCPHTLPIQTAAIDEKTTIGVVDLRTCVHIITEGSPEITNQECDYTIYAVDYLEPDTPLVGYGLLSRTISSLLHGSSMDQPPKMVTGRVTRNLLGVFSGGNRETLEVRLKLSKTTMAPRPVEHALAQVHPTAPARMPAPVAVPVAVPVPVSTATESAMTPTSNAEWASFMQSNPQIGQPVGQQAMPRVASPAALQGPPPPVEKMDSAESPIEHTPEMQRVAPTPIDVPVPPPPATSSRPSSRTSNRPPRRKPPTGRPRGRPRKKPVEGNTSGYEDGTEGEEPREEGPAKKRVKTTMIDKAESNPFNAGHESLRVVASTSSSLRNFRPIAMNPENGMGSHLQDVPRAPTPVPQGRFRGATGQGGSSTKMRHESRLGQPPALNYSAPLSEPRQPVSPSQDGRSPESLAPTPNYSEGSPLEIGSSPPVRRTASFLRSSPPPSSPVLPPMPSAKMPREARFASNEPDELLEERQARPPIEEVELPPPPPTRKEVKKVTGVPIQVFQIQDGPTGSDLVHIRSYTTPHPSSSAAPDGSSHDGSKSHSSRQSKRRRGRAPSPALQPPTPPPTTDAAEKPPPPTPIVPPVAAPTPNTAPTTTEAEAALTPSMEPKHTPESHIVHPPPQPEIQPVQPESRPQSEQSQLEPEVVPPPESRGASHVDATFELTPEPTPVAPPPIDLTHDPVFQLAMSFGMSEVPGLPQPPSSQTSPLSYEGSVTHRPPSVPLQLPQGLSPAAQPKQRDVKPENGRHLNRSQSAGPLTLPLPAAPASEPSCLSRPPTTASEPCQSHAIPHPLRRAASIGPLVLPTAESVTADLPGDSNQAPPSSPPARSNKNIVKKHAIKQRLEEAINNGEMPPFCSNCGAIETPTWRKIWVQQKEGAPETFDFSEKPGRVTAVEIIKRDEDNKPILHRIVKKSLAPNDDRKVWQEMMLCNPCGIWLSKCKCHRPPDRWDKDLSRLGQERRRRGTGRSNARPRKARSKDDAQASLVSEVFLATDGLEPAEPSSPKLAEALTAKMDLSLPGHLHGLGVFVPKAADNDCDMRSLPGSTHSQGSGTVQSPIDLDFEEGVANTKRLLFPGTKRAKNEGSSKALSNVDINIVQTSECLQPKATMGEKKEKEKENLEAAQEQAAEEQDDLESLFRSPVQERPCTPPPDAKCASAAAFKTPTRPTPSHRPITRSVSRSLRSVRSMGSPSQQAACQQRTPTRTAGASLAVPGSSSSRRRSPRNHQTGFEDSIFDTPISRRITQMLAQQGNGFHLESQGLESQGLEFGSMTSLDNQRGELIDFGSLLNPDGESGSPAKQTLGFDYDGAVDFWPTWNLENAENAMDTKE